mmetsp:Transcript_23289/g.74583  ORF Transcript_23289/g.74583 Transcript_23289/m.74583 type:complete len:279 (+) Transcript_23289:116-952(+)
MSLYTLSVAGPSRCRLRLLARLAPRALGLVRRRLRLDAVRSRPLQHRDVLAAARRSRLLPARAAPALGKQLPPRHQRRAASAAAAFAAASPVAGPVAWRRPCHPGTEQRGAHGQQHGGAQRGRLRLAPPQRRHRREGLVGMRRPAQPRLWVPDRVEEERRVGRHVVAGPGGALLQVEQRVDQRWSLASGPDEEEGGDHAPHLVPEKGRPVDDKDPRSERALVVVVVGGGETGCCCGGGGGNRGCSGLGRGCDGMDSVGRSTSFGQLMSASSSNPSGRA